MEDPNLIATLIPVDKKKRTEKAFCRRENESRYLPPQEIPEYPTISSREATPAQGLFNDDYCEYNFTHRLQLTFSEKPKDPTKGYCFGTNREKCDVLLGDRGAYGISGSHFYITFDDQFKDNFDGKTHLILKDLSTNGTAVSYSGQVSGEVRHRFIWIVDLAKEEGKWEIEVHVQGLEFKIELASHETCKAEYDKNMEDFLEYSRTADPAIGGIQLDSFMTTGSLTPGQYPIYIRERNLGRGSFGGVDKIIDVSTGAVYARKEFYEPQWAKVKERRRQQREDWLNQIRREIRIMKDNPHENIVRVMDSQEDPLPFLVMPYFPLGNLEDLHSERPIAMEEAIALFFQALNALQYLHPRGVAHRDLKPENILVASRSPLSIKLADFGLANDRPDLKTVCGTQRYTAPEVYLGDLYTASVDLWSLGVIILQYTYGLPEAPKQKRRQHNNPLSIVQEWGVAWCRRVVDYANDWESGGLIDLLTTGMLRITPEKRLYASSCLTTGYHVGLFNGHFAGLGSATPRQTALQGEIGDDDGSTTILVGALWDTVGESSYHDGNSQTGCNHPNRTFKALESRNLQAPSSPSDREGHDSQIGSFETGIDRRVSNVQSLIDHSSALEAGSKCLGYKRRRAKAMGSVNKSSSRERIKRRAPEDRLMQIPISRTDRTSDQLLGHQGESNRSYTMYDAVLTLLRDLLQSKCQNTDIDDRTNTLIGELSEYLAELEITGMRLTRNDLSGRAIVATGLDCQETVLASLTPSELTSSIADLAAHLLHMVHLQNPRPISTSTVPVEDPPPRTCIITDDDRSQSWTVSSIDSPVSSPTARQYGLTYPSVLLDCANVSGGSIPSISC